MKIKDLLFGIRCNYFLCFRKPWKYLTGEINGRKIILPHCEKHAKIIDKLFKEKQVDLGYKYHYEELEE